MSNKQPGCKAICSGGQMYCTECGVTWDLDDEPAECNPIYTSDYHAHIVMIEPDKKKGIDALIKIKEKLNRE